MARSRIFAHGVGISTIAMIVLALVPTALAAQERPGAVAEFSAGWIGFPDDGEMVSEGVVGGAARWYVTPRVSVGPELLWINGENHRHLVLTGNMTFDLLPPVADQPRKVTPFIVLGGGLFQTHETFFAGDFTSTEGAFTVGGGLRARAGDRVAYGIDARIGWESHLRLNGFIGVRLGH